MKLSLWVGHVGQSLESEVLTSVCFSFAQTLQYDHTHTASSMLFPAITRTTDMTAVSPGIWQYSCDVQDHLIAGMRARLVVTK